MNGNNRIRQVHRWLSIVFTMSVAANVAALVLGNQTVWVGVLALVPLVLLMLTGLYLFALPYVSKRRGVALHAPGASNGIGQAG